MGLESKPWIPTLGVPFSLPGVAVVGCQFLPDRNQVWLQVVLEEGREDEAIAALLDCLRPGEDVSFADHQYDEGAQCIGRTEAGYTHSEGGHGWSSRTRPIDRAEAEAVLATVARWNRGPEQRSVRYLTQYAAYLYLCLAGRALADFQVSATDAHTPG